MNIYIETYGCSENQAESEIMAGILTKSGYNIVRKIEDADLAVLNTCYVKSVTEQKIFYRIGEIQKVYPDKKMVIAGCISSAAPERLVEIAPSASLLSTHKITKIGQVVKKTLEGKRVEEVGEEEDVKLLLPKIRINPIIDIVPISSGCSGACSFCATKIAKGNVVSYPSGKILDEIRIAVKGGCKEIWLTSQDTGAYGMDKGERSLPRLLKWITSLDGKFFVRLGMINPDHVNKMLIELIEAYNSKKMYKFLHAPVQSGDNEILKKMLRPYFVEEFKEIVDEFRKAYRMTIWTDVIVGFPEETEEQFKRTLELIKETKLDWVNISRYAMRPGTKAAELEQLPTDIVKERTRKLTNIVNIAAHERNREWINWEGEILISEKGKKNGQWIGRNFAYKPVIINKSGDLLGKIIKVKIIDAIPTALEGWPIK
jgi:MiaB-like tRNA modifying enzyme